MDLIFVYNARSGRLSALFDAGHKIFSPNTYGCNLCALTHGAFSERSAWKRFKESTSMNLTFLHKDEFERQFGPGFTYPVVLIRRPTELGVFLSTADLKALSTPDQLIELITVRASNTSRPGPCSLSVENFDGEGGSRPIQG